MLRLAVIGQVFIWTIATLVPLVIMAYDASHLGLQRIAERVCRWPHSGIGIGVGCLVAGKLSASKVEYGLLPLGAHSV